MKRMIRRGLACLVAVLMLVTSSGGAITALARPLIQVLPSKGENLLVNGDFEDPTDEISWSLTEAQITSAAAYSGGYGLRLTRGEIDAKATYLFTQVALAPNTTYTLTGDVRSTADSDLDVSFEVTGGTATATKGSMGTKDNKWSHQTLLTIKTGVDYVYGKVLLSIYRGAAATTDVDNLQMIATGEEWCPTPTGHMVKMTDVLYDDFNDTMLDSDKWLVSEKGWGGANGGLAAANLSLGIEDGRTCVILESHGDRYEGNVKGVGGATKRVGSGFATRDYYASAEYEVVCKIDNILGVCTAFWSFSYIQYEEGDEKFNELVGNIRNTEIDWETPSPMDTSTEDDHVSLNNLRTNCWGGKRPGEGGNYSGRGHNTNNSGEIISIADGKWHNLTYKWYSTSEPRTKKPAVVWYIDGKEVDAYDINNEHYNDGLTPEADPNNYEALKKYIDQGVNVPYRGARFWLACWFPVKESKLYVVGDHSATTGWAGTPDFDVAHTYIDSVKITPFNDQSMDEYGDLESVPNLAWALPNQYPGYAETHGVMDAPTPDTDIDGQTATATWNAIAGATGYDVKLDGKTYTTSTPSYIFQNLDVGNHTLQVRAKNANTTGIWSYEAMISIGVPEVTAVAQGSSIKVTWDPVPGATTYYMEIDNDPVIVEGAYIPFTSGTINSYLSDKEDGLHMIRVRSEGPKGMSNWSQQKYVLVGSSYELKTPTLNVAKNGKELTFTVSKVTNATGYELLDTDTGDVTTMSTTSTKKTVADGTHTYKVRAVNKIGPSEWSEAVTVKVGASATIGIPSPTAAAAGNNQINVNWATVSGATAYDIEIDGVTVSGVSSPYGHVNLGSGTTHRYRVRAKTASGTGDWSAYVYATTTGTAEESGTGGGDKPADNGSGCILNGDFASDMTYWETTGDVQWENGHVKITGSDETANVLQTVKGLKPNTTYTFSADLEVSEGLFAYLIIRNYDGKSGELSSQTSPLTFTTGDDITGVTFMVQVYKQQTGTVIMDNAWLSEGNKPTAPTSGTTGGSGTTGSGGNPTQPQPTYPTESRTTHNGTGTTATSGEGNSDISGSTTGSDVSGESTGTTGSDVSGDIPETGVVGDANGDNSVDMKDVLLIRKHIAHMSVSLNLAQSDVNHDDSVDMKDVLLIRKFVAHMIDSF